MKEIFSKLDISRLCDIYGEMLTAKQREMLKLSNDFDVSLSEIAEQFGITRQAVHDSINKALDSLKELESKLHLYEKIDKIAQITQDITQTATESVKNKVSEIMTILGE